MKTIPASRGVRSSFGSGPLMAIWLSFAYPIANPPTSAAWYSAFAIFLPSISDMMLFHIVRVWCNLQLLSRPFGRQDRGLFLLWRRFYRRAVRGVQPIGQPRSSHQCAYPQGDKEDTGAIEPAASFLSLRGASSLLCFCGGATTNAGSRKDSLAAASSLSRRSDLAFLAAAPARPAATFFGSFCLGDRLGAGAVSAVTLKTGCAG